MKVIKILGTGCPSCVSAEKIVLEVVNELNIAAKIVKITDIMDIMQYDVMSTPAIVVGEKVMFKGKVPSKNEVKAIIVDNFNFDHQVVRHNYNTVYVWRSQNPVNGLEYGYGGVKLLPTKEI